MNGEENLRLLEQIDAHRCFILQAYLENPGLLVKAESRIRWMLGMDATFPALAEQQEKGPVSNDAPLHLT